MNVPRLKEFCADKIYQMAMEDRRVFQYLPDPINSKIRPSTRLFYSTCKPALPSWPSRYLITDCRINTLEPKFFISNINNAYAKRRDKEAVANNRFIEINPQFYALLNQSNHVSKCKYARS